MRVVSRADPTGWRTVHHAQATASDDPNSIIASITGFSNYTYNAALGSDYLELSPAGAGNYALTQAAWYTGPARYSDGGIAQGENPFSVQLKISEVLDAVGKAGLAIVDSSGYGVGITLERTAATRVVGIFSVYAAGGDTYVPAVESSPDALSVAAYLPGIARRELGRPYYGTCSGITAAGAITANQNASMALSIPPMAGDLKWLVWLGSAAAGGTTNGWTFKYRLVRAAS